jgi:hypothetical protein
VKYFFLSDGWICGRVWEFGGLWDETAHRHSPYIEKLNIGIMDKGELFWLYQAEEAILMVEVIPTAETPNPALSIGQVVLKRLISAEDVIERLKNSDQILKNETGNET